MPKNIKNYISLLPLFLFIVTFVLGIINAFSSLDQLDALLETYLGYAPYVKYITFMKTVPIMSAVVGFFSLLLSVPCIYSVAKNTLSRSTAFPFLLSLQALSSMIAGFITIAATKTLAAETNNTSYKTSSSAILFVIFLFIVFALCLITVGLIRSQKCYSRATLPLVFSFTIWLGLVVYDYSQLSTYTPLAKANLTLDIIVASAVILIGTYDFISDLKNPTCEPIQESKGEE